METAGNTVSAIDPASRMVALVWPSPTAGGQVDQREE